MSYYNGEHSITFISTNGTSKNTWTDWHLIPSARPTIQPPPPQTFTLEIPGRSGKLDFSDYIFNSPVFNNREGSFEFIVDHENTNYISWSATKEEILNFIHARWFKVILQDEPDYYYEGRITIDELKSNSDWSVITFKYDLKPSKLSIVDTLSDWLWDPFSFITGHIRANSDFEFELYSSQSAVPYTIEGVENDSEVEISSNNARAVYHVISKNNSGYDRHYAGYGTDVIKFNMVPSSPMFYIILDRPTETKVKFYVKFVGGKI